MSKCELPSSYDRNSSPQFPMLLNDKGWGGEKQKSTQHTSWLGATEDDSVRLSMSSIFRVFECLHKSFLALPRLCVSLWNSFDILWKLSTDQIPRVVPIFGVQSLGCDQSWIEQISNLKIVIPVSFQLSLSLCAWFHSIFKAHLNHIDQVARCWNC